MSVFMFDSNSELSYKVADRFPDAVPILMPYVIDDEVLYYDLGRNTDFKAFFDRMRNGAVPKTMALNPGEYVEYIEPIFQKGQDILYISFSHAMSGTFSSLNMALEQLAEQYPERKLTLVNSENISVGAGILVYQALCMRENGASDEEIIHWIEENKNRVNCWFCVDDLVYLKRGGRISPTVQIVGSLLEIKPILTVNRGGTIVVDHKEKGRKKSIKALYDTFVNRAENTEEGIVYIVHADCLEDAEYLAKKISEDRTIKEVVIQYVGPVIGSHAGPGTIGIIFMGKER